MIRRDLARFMDVLLGKQQRSQKVFFMGIVTQASPLLIRLDGDTAARTSAYPKLAGYTPQLNDRVVLANVNGYFIAIGKVG